MGEEKGQREKKKITARKLIGALAILAGIGVFCYPLCVQAYNAYAQKKMIEELRENIAAAQDGMVAGAETKNPQEKEEKSAACAEALATPEHPDGEKATEGTGYPMAAEPDSIETAQGGEQENQGIRQENQGGGQENQNQNGGQEAQGSSLEGTFAEGEEENPEEDAQEEETRPDRLNGKKVIGLIEIEAISLIYPIVEGAETEDIGVAIGHMPDTAELGAIGNCALAGHRGGYSGPYFKKLDELKAGDEVVITNAKGNEFVYKVTEAMVVEPTEVWVAEDTGEGKALLTLITCEEDGDKRLVVRCELVP